MKKISILGIILISLCFNQQVSAQTKKSNVVSGGETNPMQVGSILFNVGLGVGAGYRYGTYGTPWGFKAAAEFGVWQAGPGVITLGPELGGTFSGDKANGKDYINSTFVVAGRAAWHYGWDVPGLDTYGGFSAGIGFNHYSDVNDDHNSPFPFFGAFAGASYFITPTFGFNSEFGYDITNFQVGVVFKLQ